MKYLITGGAGFIGSAIAKKLLKLKHEVTIIDNLSTGLKSNIPNGCLFIKGDISKKATFKPIENSRYDAILHIAGQSSGEISFEDPIKDLNSNTLSTVLLLQYALKTGCKKFVFSSSMSVYGQRLNKQKYSENDSINPLSFYAIGKLASENYIKLYNKNYGIDYTILRYFNDYGEGQNLENLKQGIVSIYIAQFLSNSFDKVLVKGSNKRFRDLCHISDVVNITVQSIGDRKFKNITVNVGTGVKTTVREMILSIKKLLSSNKKIIYQGSTPGDQFGIYANNNKIKKIYKSNFLEFRLGLKRMIDYIKANER